jgi:hypothetical protein
MKISMWMLFDAIADAVHDHNLNEVSQMRCLEGVLPLLQGEQMTDDHVYLGHITGLSELCRNEESFLIIYGDGSPGPDGAVQYIRLMPELDMSAAFRLVLKAFEKYNAWFDKLQQELIGNPDLMRLCETGNELIENYITLFDPEHILLAYAAMPPGLIGSVLEQKSGPHYVLTDTAYKAMINSPYHQDDTQAERAAFSYDPMTQLRVLYANVGPGRFECRLCIGEEKRPFKRSDPQLCEILAEVLLVALEKDHLSGISAKTNLRDMIQGILREKSVDDFTLDQNLKIWQWSRHDRFICMEIEKMNPDSKFLSNDRYVCSRVEELLKDACAFMLEGKVVCVARLMPQDQVKQILDRIGGFLRDSIFIVGVSDAFSDISDIGNYHREACIAVQLGRAKRPNDWYHAFARYALLHFYQNGTSVLPAVYYCDSNVRKLMESRDSKVDYCETLRVYLENDRNLLHAARTLNIHRTTLFYRLNRISEIIGGDLDDPAVRLRMLFSFELLEMDQNPEKFIRQSNEGTCCSRISAVT